MNTISDLFLAEKFALRYVSIITKVASIIAIALIISALTNIAMAQTIGDSASVYKFVEEYQQTINTRDPVALATFFTDDADLMMFNLPGVHGRKAIENWWRDVWQSKFNKQELGRRGTFILNSVRFLAADVAVTNIETTTGGQDSLGAELQTRKARGTWLLNRQNGNWLISAILGMPTERDSIILKASLETTKSLRPHIRTFVDAYEDAFNSHDPSAVSAFFRNDADIIVRNLPLIQGKQAIQDWWGNYFSKPRYYTALFIIDEIRTISDDVAQLNFTVTGAFPETENEPQPIRQTQAMWIIVREAGKWHIAALRVLPGKDDRIIRR